MFLEPTPGKYVGHMMNHIFVETNRAKLGNMRNCFGQAAKASSEFPKSFMSTAHHAMFYGSRVKHCRNQKHHEDLVKPSLLCWTEQITQPVNRTSSQNGCGSKNQYQNGTLVSGNMGTKTCGLPLLFNFEPHPNVCSLQLVSVPRSS